MGEATDVVSVRIDVRTPARPYPEYVEYLAETVTAAATEEAERRGLRLLGMPTWWVYVHSEFNAQNECRLCFEQAAEPADG